MAKGINIFDSAKGKPKPSSSAKDKPTVEVDGIEGQLNELQNLKTQIANLETQLDVVTDEIKTIAKEKFVELYLEKGRNPNTFLLKDGTGCVMVIPTDKYISIKDEDRANELIENYGEEIVTIDEKYYFNPEVLERNMKAIEKLIRDAKGISDADKQNLLVREVKYSITKGTIDELAEYGEDMESVINDIQPIITLKNCGGKMAEGGTDGEFIANIYENGGMMSHGGMTENEKYNLLYNFVDEKMIEGDEVAERIINGELPNGYNDLYDYVDEKMVEGDSEAAKLLNKINKYAHGGISSKSVKKLINEVRENGEFMDSYMVDESQTVSNAGEQESYIYNGKNYLITTWNERAENHLDGEESIYIDKDYKYASGGLFGSSRYNEGLSWHLDHARHNKKENYEVPVNKRKRRFKK